jgi:CBS domain-containing protein
MENVQGQKRRLDDIGSFVREKRCFPGTIKEILETKGSHVWTVPAGMIVFDALKFMADRNIGAVVVQEGRKVVGVVSERDYARKIILVGKTSLEATTREIMSTPVLSVSPEASVEECMSLMTNSRIRHLPVLDGENLVGLVSIGDLVKQVIAYQRHLIGQYEGYVRGTYPA